MKDAKNGHDKYYRTIRVSASYWKDCKRELFTGVNYSNFIIEKIGECSSMSSDKFSAGTNDFGVREKFYIKYVDDQHFEKATTFSERQTQQNIEIVTSNFIEYDFRTANVLMPLNL